MTSPVTSQTSLAELLAECVRQDASDVHLAPGLMPYFRIHGLLQPHDKFPILSAADTEALGTELGRNFNRASLQTTGSLDGAVSAAACVVSSGRRAPCGGICRARSFRTTFSHDSA
jgi:Tfp pilus assembly pilus retraction ATPase PilT